jgi:predicted nucleic acid-binding protein
VRLFLDTSVLLAASGTGQGASRYLIRQANEQNWVLVSTDYCADEARRNLAKVGHSAAAAWRSVVSPAVEFTDVRVALDRPLVFPKAKDRPVVISALAAQCEWLLTLDEKDFQGNLGHQIYGMAISTPGKFLLAQRDLGVL